MSSVPVRLAVDPIAMKRSVGLRYVSDDMPGITRVRRGGAFVYVDQRKRLIRSKNLLKRVRNLVIPPAWQEVWICPRHDGHIQAVGRDARGRKQYLYHSKWQHIRDETKFHRMLTFGKALPKIRRQVRNDLRKSGLTREKVLATVITLLEYTHIRVGNKEYAKQNNSYGLTTFKDRHAEVRGARVRFRFRGKSGKEHEVELKDPRLARIVRACQDIPGQELFQYYDEQGQSYDVSSTDVNAYLREITGQDFTAKDFRTWAGTVLFVDALRHMQPCKSSSEAQRKLVELIREVAAQLCNTPTICRKYYIHPFTIDGFLDQSIHETIERLCRSKRKGRPIPTEKLVLRLLTHAARATPGTRSKSP